MPKTTQNINSNSLNMNINVNVNGVVNIYKEKGFTSHDVVAIVRKTLRENSLGKVKTGHTGTLDPDAMGVLPICLGKATKISDYIMTGDKTYIATLKLGIITDTLDTSGNILETFDVNASKEEILKVINSFIGEYEQLPPMYSALKVNGQKLCDLAREGIEIERKTRLVKIHKIYDINFLAFDEIEFTVDCSKGVYIRTLCEDIGRKLACGGAMSSLIRTKTSSFTQENSVTLEKFKEFVDNSKLDELLIPITDVLPYPKLNVNPFANKYLYNGNPISLNFIIDFSEDYKNSEMFYLFDEFDKNIGLYKLENNKLIPQIIFST